MSSYDLSEIIKSIQTRISNLEMDRDSMHQRIYNIELETFNYNMPLQDWFQKAKKTAWFITSERKGEDISKVIKDVNTYLSKNSYEELVTEDLYQIILELYNVFMDHARQQRTFPFAPHVAQYFIHNLREIDPKFFRKYRIYR